MDFWKDYSTKGPKIKTGKSSFLFFSHIAMSYICYNSTSLKIHQLADLQFDQGHKYVKKYLEGTGGETSQKFHIQKREYLLTSALRWTWTVLHWYYGFSEHTRHLWKQLYSTAKLIFHSVYCRVCRWEKPYLKITNILFSGNETPQKINVTGLLISLVVAGVMLVIIGLLIFYCCKSRCKSRQPPG